MPMVVAKWFLTIMGMIIRNVPIYNYYTFTLKFHYEVI